MAWVKIDDHFDEHPKLQKVGPIGWGYWLAGLAYCNRNMTDGFIPWSKAHSLCSFTVCESDNKLTTLTRVSGMSGDNIDAEWVIELLVLAELWDEVDGGFLIHDYEQYQPTKAQIEQERLKKVAAGQAGGQASAQASAQARAKPPAKPRAQAKSNPVPVPVPLNSSIDIDENESPFKPFDLFEAMCEASGVDISEIDGNARARQLKTAKQMIESGATPDDVRREMKWLQSQSWVTGGIDMALLAGQWSKWVLAGKPESSQTTAANPNGMPPEIARLQWNNAERIKWEYNHRVQAS